MGTYLSRSSLFYKLNKKLSSVKHILFILLFLAFLPGKMFAAARTASVTGNWSNTATWGGQAVPTNADDVTINEAITVTVDQTAECLSLTFGPITSTNSVLTMSGTNTLAVTGLINMPRPSSGETCTINVNAGAITCGSLTMNATTISTGTRTDIINISTGSLVVSGTITTGTTGCVFTFSDTGILQLSGSTSGGPPTLTAGTGTVIYDRPGVQTIWVKTYNNLTLGGTSVKTVATTPTINGILSMEGTATITVTTGVVTYGAAATLQYNTATGRTASTEEWLATFAATGGVIISNTGTINPGANKVFNLNIPLTIDPGATFNAANRTFSFGGDFINNGTWTASTGAITIASTRATQSIGAFVTTALVSMTKTGGTATFQGNVGGAGLTINGAGGTLNLGTALTHTFTGVVTLTNGTLNGGSSVLNVNVVSATAWGGNGTKFTPGTSTVDFGAAGNQTLSATSTAFNNIEFSGTGTKTLSTDNTVSANLTVRAGVTLAKGTRTLGSPTSVTLETVGGGIGSIITGTTGNFTLGGDITVNYTGSGAITTGASITAIVALGATRNIDVVDDVNSTTPELTVSGVISGAAFGITKLGAGTLVLSGSNTYTGITTIDVGTIKLGATGGITNTPLGTAAAGTSVTDGAALDLAGFTLANTGTFEALTLNGPGVSSGGALMNSGAAATYKGLITLGSASSIEGGTGTIALSNVGTISGATFGLTLGGAQGGSVTSIIGTTSGTVTKEDVGTWTLSGANTFSGGTNLNAGQLNINNLTAIGTGSLTISNGTTIDNTSGGAIGPLTNNNAQTWDGSFTFTGSNNLDMGTGAITMSADVNITSSAIAKTLTIGGINNNGARSLTKAGTGNLTFGSADVTLNNFTLSAGTLTSTSGSLFLAGNFANSSTFTHNNGTVTFNGTGAQSINSGGSSFNNFSITNTGGTCTASTNDITVAGTFTTDASTTLDMATKALSVATVAHSGTLKTQFVGASPVTAAKSWGGVLTFNATTSGQTIVSGTYTTLNSGGTSGTNTLSGDIGVSGTLTIAASTTFSFGTIARTVTLSGTGSNTLVNNNVIDMSGGPNAAHILKIAASSIATFGTLTTGTGSKVEYTVLTGGQTVNPVTYHNLQIDNTSGTNTTGGNLTVNGTFTTTASGILDMGTNTLSVGSVAHSGILKTQHTGATPITTAKTWGGTVEYNAAATQTIVAGTYNNLTISGAGNNSKTAAADVTVNGILNLSSANFSATQGCLEMDTYTLTMGVNATTTGTGDVTGIVKRSSFITDTPHSFGNQFTTMSIATGGTLPTDVSFKIAIGIALPGKSDAVLRKYDIIRTGGSGTTVTLQLHFLTSELQGNTENNLVMWDDVPSIPKVEEHGKASQNTTDHWLAISYRNITYFATTFDTKLWGVSDKISPDFVWLGAASTDWNDINNWTGGVVPIASSDVIIPDAATTIFDPLLPSGPSATAKTIKIQSSAIIDGGAATTLTVAGNGGAWLNEGGTLNPGTSTVVFTGASATIAGTTNFYNVTVENAARLEPQSAGIIGIAGTMTLNGSGIFDADDLVNTVDFNGASQTVLNPNGPSPGYYHLIFSGSGTKTLPGAEMKIKGDFTNNVIFAHNSGLVTFRGSGAQSINTGGSSFNDFKITNTAGTCTASNSITVAGTFTTRANTTLDMVTFPLSVNVVADTCTLKTQNTSASPITAGKTWGDTVQYNAAAGQTIVEGNYNTLDGTGGNRTLSSTGTVGIAEAFTVGAGTYTITSSTVDFNGTAAQNIPAFNFNNLTISGNKGSGAMTLVNGGTIGVAGAFSVTATNTSYTVTGNTFDYNGSGAQTITANVAPFTTYNNLVISNAGVKTITSPTAVTCFTYTENDAATLDIPGTATLTITKP